MLRNLLKRLPNNLYTTIPLSGFLSILFIGLTLGTCLAKSKQYLSYEVGIQKPLITEYSSLSPTKYIEANFKVKSSSVRSIPSPNSLVRIDSDTTELEYGNKVENSKRYFFQPGAYGLRKRESYYQNAMLLINQINVGITDNFLLGGGIIPFFAPSLTYAPLWLNTKITFPIYDDKLVLGLSGYFFTIFTSSENSNFGIAIANATYGSNYRNITIGIGYGYSDGELATSPSFNLSAVFKLTSQWFFVTENYFSIGSIVNVDALSMAGFRLAGKKSDFDFGAIVLRNKTDDINLALPYSYGPWFSLIIPFSTKSKED
jgi:hypothetical protein